MLIENVEKLHIVSPFGERYREGMDESHYGIDIRVFDKGVDPSAKYIFKVLAPEQIRIIKVKFDPTWGHWITTEPTGENEFGIIQFRFWHVSPGPYCIEGALFDENEVLGMPEAGYVPLHLHFETRISAPNGTKPIDPMPYLKSKGLV